MEFPVPSTLCPPVVSPAPWGRCPRELAQGLPAYRATATLVYLFARSVHKSGHEQVTVLHKFCNVAYYASYYKNAHMVHWYRLLLLGTFTGGIAGVGVGIGADDACVSASAVVATSTIAAVVPALMSGSVMG